ncbi:DNA glycosylase [Vallitaleaceae bacterium 9-2]
MYVLKIPYEELDIYKILQSGQVFRYEVISEKDYVLIYQNHYVHVKKVEGGYHFYCEEQEFYTVWSLYLALDLNYQEINQAIIKADPRLEAVIQEQKGLRILRQDPFEMLLTFIISQSKAIPQIRKLVNALSDQYGQYLGEVESRPIYAFPTSHALQEITQEQFRAMKFGYRAPYLVDAIKQVCEGKVVLDLNASLDANQTMEMLKQIKGVGDKVASCVALFGLGYMEAFPVDVWMRKTMVYLYDTLDAKTKDIHIQQFGEKLFGVYAGIAQQYIFEYGRQMIKIL